MTSNLSFYDSLLRISWGVILLFNYFYFISFMYLFLPTVHLLTFLFSQKPRYLCKNEIILIKLMPTKLRIYSVYCNALLT